MPMGDGLWTEVTPSEFAHEQAALNFLRERLPDREPFRAWSNFTFQADDGRRYEVDLLVVAPSQVFLVEIKSHPNRISGDAGTWTWTTPDGARKSFDNPLRLAEAKAKKLKSLLLNQSAFRDHQLRRDAPWFRSVVFLSDPDLLVDLDDHAATDVFGPDAGTDPQRNDLPGIVEALKHVDAGRRGRVDRPMSRALAQAMDQAGVRQSQALRRAGHYELKDLIAEGEGWQDFETVHTGLGEKRRIRLYLVGRAQSEEERDALLRAAKREYHLLKGIDHPGIERPVDMLPNPRGPALVFPTDPKAVRLDHWLRDHGDTLDLLDRIELVRQLAETLRAAHQSGLYHRVLSPEHITVADHAGGRRIRIRDWQAATREVSSTTSAFGATGTSHVAKLVHERAHVYLAPELTRVPDALPRPADLWSLGAVAYLILTGQPPAADLDGLYALLKEHGSLTLAAGMDAPDNELDLVVQTATKVDATSRFVSVDEFLEYLDLALEHLTTPEPTDPLDAHKGDLIGDWTVIRRFGSGSTSVVLLAERDGRTEVLKVARDEDHAVRLHDEYEVLTNLRDRRIVEAFDFERVAGRSVLRLQAAESTLGHVLEQDGPLSLDLLQRYGDDLLDALVVLEDEGVAHRDIKPENLGIAEVGKNHERHLLLFDFSLSRADAENINAGTAAYLDPFLSERPSKRWDFHAERYAAAVTLHEMATGTRPAWGDGSTDPVLTELQTPHLHTGVADPAIREALTAFLARALHRDPAHRFDTASEMRGAWDRIFSAVDKPATTTHADDGASADEADLSELAPSTPLVDLGLTARLLNALDRLGIATAHDLATVPPSELVRLGGIGAAVRREIGHLADRIRAALDSPAVVGDGASVDGIAEQLVPRPPADEDHRTVVSTFLGLQGWATGTIWPSQRAVVTETKLDEALVTDALGSARTRWRNRPDVTSLRAEIVGLLQRRDGIAGGEELARAVLANRGSASPEPERTRRARAAVRAAVETEATLQAPRFVGRRVGEVLLLSLDGEVTDEDGTVTSWQADPLVEAAAELGIVADELADERPMVTPDRVVARLRAVELPDGVGPFTDSRLVRLAAAASSTAAVSSRLELYPAGMEPVDALVAARGTLLDKSGLTVEQLTARVRARFPAAAALPKRPTLDRLLDEAGTGLHWHSPGGGQPGRYVLAERGGVVPTSFSTATGRTTTYASPDERVAALLEIDARFERLGGDGGFLALTVDPRHLRDACAHVAAVTRGQVVDLDAILIAEMRQQAAKADAQWVRFVEADADPGGPHFPKLRQLASRAMSVIEDQLKSHASVVVMHNVGLLARYGQMGMLERLRDQLTRMRNDAALAGLAVVVPGNDPTARPIIGGEPIPVITPNQWAHLPSAWLDQRTAA